MKILIVDDSTFMRTMIKKVMKEEEVEISEASNSEEAIKQYQEFKPDLVFLDIILPGKDGIEILRDIRSLDANAKVVMCSSVGGQEEIINEAIKEGASDIIVKPFKPDEILGIINKFRN